LSFVVVVAVAVALSLIVQVLPVVSAQDATPVASPSPSVQLGPLPPAWLEFGPDGQLFARVIVDGECPLFVVDDVPAVMTRRSSPTAAFPVVACEATVPFGAASATIRDQPLPLPDGPFQRIAVIGDTGCRLNEWEGRYQACNDPADWPFATVAQSVADWEPDLIIHVGDYLYRESACPTGMAGCLGSPFGDNWATWNADFFTPVASLLGTAPWVVMRGNHETCGRNPEGWFAYLDPRPYQPECQRFTEPYVAVLNGLPIAVIDSAEASDTTVAPDEEAQYARQFELLSRIVAPNSWLITHRPVWGILEGKKGEFAVVNASYEAATGGALKGGFALVLSGHIHLAEAISFDATSERPPQIISGNSGTALDDIPSASPTAGQLGQPDITDAETLSSFGFLTLEPDGETWTATQRDADGAPLIACHLDLPEVRCDPAHPED
jgi:hypothetical protein